MDPDFWHDRWREGRIGFHQETVTPWLPELWPTLALPTGSQIFVPLAGKSLDMLWLRAQGHRVLGVELSQLAVEQFFAAHGLVPAIRESRHGTRYTDDGIELICGNVFALDAEALADCAGVFDRAALIALPPELRRRYVGEVYAHLPGACRGLLVTLEYPQHQKCGPPFSVDEAEVRTLYEPDWTVTVLDRADALAMHPGFIEEGVSALATVAYRVDRLSPETKGDGGS